MKMQLNRYRITLLSVRSTSREIDIEAPSAEDALTICRVNEMNATVFKDGVSTPYESVSRIEALPLYWCLHVGNWGPPFPLCKECEEKYK